MGSYLGVAASSANPPHFIHLCYKPPNGEVKTKLALVGKGLTFDSGGYNIKTGAGCLIGVGVSELFSREVVARLRIDPNLMHSVDFFPRGDGLVERNYQLNNPTIQ